MFKLKIETGNAAFEDPYKAEEIGRILHLASIRLRQGETSGKLRDSNGNTVGEFALT